MPLPSKSDVDSKKECISKAIAIEIKAGKTKEQATAIAHSHCDKIFELKNILENIREDKEELNEIKKELEKLSVDETDG